jgi:hypothetical protein
MLRRLQERASCLGWMAERSGFDPANSTLLNIIHVFHIKTTERIDIMLVSTKRLRCGLGW